MNNEINHEIKAVILDVDQTLTTDTPSWLQFTQILGANPKIHQQIYDDFKNGDLEYKDAKKKLIDLWKTKSGLSRSEIIEYISHIKFRKNVHDAMEYLKGKYKLCLISGAIDIFVEEIGNKLGIEDRYASTKFIFDESDRLTDFEYTLSRGEEKLKFLDDFCQKHSIKPEECAAIGDGDSDMPIFEHVKLPILFLAKETPEEAKRKIISQLSDWANITNYL